MQQRSFGRYQSAEQDTLRARVGQLVDQKRELEHQLDVDGGDAGLEERKANVERGLAKASKQLETLGDEYRAELRRRVDEGTVSTESEQDQIDPGARGD